MSRFRSLQTRAYDKLPQVLAIKKALEAKTDFPATGEGSDSEKAETLDRSSSSITKRSIPEPNGSPIQTDALTAGCEKPEAPTRVAQPLLNLGHVFREVERRAAV